MAFVTDTFTDTAGTLIENHTGETGATWTIHPTATGSSVISDANRARGASSNSFYYASGLPAAAEYDVSADRFVVSNNTGGWAICGRMDVTAATFYMWRYIGNQQEWNLFKRVGGTFTLLGTYAQVLTNGNTYASKLEIRDAAKKGYVDGVERVSSADNAITDAGRVGMYFNTSTTFGIHIDNLSGDDAAAAQTIAPSPIVAE